MSDAPNACESIEIFPDSAALTRAAAEDFVRLAKAAIAARGVFTVALAGGSTPKRLYTLLADESTGALAAPWEKIHCFFSDERHVGPDDAESNYRMARETMLARLPQLPAENVHRIRAENPDAAAAAAEYEAELRAFFESRKLVTDGFPRFDLILLGMGPDGHTASLFPESKGLYEKERWVISNRVEKFKTDRITFTYPVLNHAAQVALFVAGKDKADMLHEVLIQYRDTPRYPVQLVRPVAGKKIWMLDRDVAAKL